MFLNKQSDKTASWKKKALERCCENNAFKKRIKELEHSRDEWREKAKKFKKELQQCKQEKKTPAITIAINRNDMALSLQLLHKY